MLSAILHVRSKKVAGFVAAIAAAGLTTATGSAARPPVQTTGTIDWAIVHQGSNPTPGYPFTDATLAGAVHDTRYGDGAYVETTTPVPATPQHVNATGNPVVYFADGSIRGSDQVIIGSTRSNLIAIGHHITVSGGTGRFKHARRTITAQGLFDSTTNTATVHYTATLTHVR